ncbi:MAG: lipase, partial [Ulvibacter sp.]|nr:lipase [Ulvibacter sp.]
MRELYKKAVVLLAVLLSSTLVHSQCEEITIESLSNPGIYNVATLTEADGLRNGPDYFGATVYYPTNGTPPYASIAIVPGFTAGPDSVEAWGPFYASHGIVTIIIGTNSIYDFPEARAEALLDALETLRQENTRNASPLLGAIDEDKFAVSGWSMGGGGAQRAAVLDNSIKGVVALCPWLPSPDLDHSSPVVIFSGQNDAVAPPGNHANIHYDNTPNSTNKLLFEVENGN